MKTIIPVISAIGFISAVIGIIFFIIALSKKMLHYSPNVRQQVSEKIIKNFYIAGTLFTISTFCFVGAKKIIKIDFHNSLACHKIIYVEVNGVYFSQYDIENIFNHFEPTEARYRCNSFNGFINLENNEYIPIEIIRHCYEKNRYIIISKKYNLDADIGEITTSKFDYIESDSDNP